MVAHWLMRTAVLIAVGAALAACEHKPGTVKDEAMEAGFSTKDMAGLDDAYLRAMDRGLTKEAVHKALPFLSKEEAWKSYNRGRNNWVMWTGGNDRFWDYLANNSFVPSIN